MPGPFFNKVIRRDGNILSVATNHFSIDKRKDRYYGKVIRLIENQNSTRVSCLMPIESFGSLLKKETPTQVFPCEFCEIFKNSFFIEHFWWFILYFIRIPVNLERI